MSFRAAATARNPLPLARAGHVGRGFFAVDAAHVFGSGLVIVPFLKTEVVDHYHWLGNAEFLDAVAVGMISPARS